MKSLVKMTIAVLVSLFVQTAVLAHGGGLDSDGGHSEIESYHCHTDSCKKKEKKWKERFGC